MKRAVSVVVISLIISTACFSGEDSERSSVKSVIRNAYFNGAFNEQDTGSMRKGFHPGFEIFSAEGNRLKRYPIDQWIESIEEKKKAPGYDPERVKLDCRIINLDITGGAAAAKVRIARGDKLLFTDYLSLLKFDDGWKIVAKVYHRN
jgi:hypothetical protein